MASVKKMIPPIFNNMLEIHTSIYLEICVDFFSLSALKTQYLPKRKFTIPPKTTPVAEETTYTRPTSDVNT